MKKIFIFPGNPPAKHFYQEWINELKQTIDADYTIMNYSINEEPNSDLVFRSIKNDLKVQLGHLTNDDSVIFLSHSLGGYFAFSMQRELKLQNIKHISIFPFLGSPDFKSMFVLESVHRVQKSKKLKQITKLTFSKILKPIIKDLKFITESEIETCLYLAGHERNYFRKLKTDTVNEKLHHAHLIFNNKDLWSTQKTTTLLKDYMTTHETHEPHDFIRYPKARKTIIKQMVKLF